MSQLANSINNAQLTEEQEQFKQVAIQYVKMNPEKFENLRQKGEKKFADLKEGYDYQVCALCGGKTGDITAHLKAHNMKFKDYQPIWGGESKTQKQKDNIKGDKNPAYQHGGKYSPFSKNFIKGYDEEKHKEWLKTVSETNKTSTTNPISVHYWIKKCDGDVELGTKQWKEAQTRGKEFFVNKYGEEEGTKRYHAKTDKWLATLDAMSDEERDEMNRKKISANNGSSKTENKIYEILKETIPDLKTQFHLKEGKKSFFFDYHLGNKLIEYNGDFWHANPEKYNEEHVCRVRGKTYDEIHANDKRKLEAAQAQGFEVLVIWESDYKKDKEGTLQKCIQFLTKN